MWPVFRHLGRIWCLLIFCRHPMRSLIRFAWSTILRCYRIYCRLLNRQGWCLLLLCNKFVWYFESVIDQQCPISAVLSFYFLPVAFLSWNQRRLWLHSSLWILPHKNKWEGLSCQLHCRLRWLLLVKDQRPHFDSSLPSAQYQSFDSDILFLYNWITLNYMKNIE